MFPQTTETSSKLNEREAATVAPQKPHADGSHDAIRQMSRLKHTHAFGTAGSKTRPRSRTLNTKKPATKRPHSFRVLVLELTSVSEIPEQRGSVHRGIAVETGANHTCSVARINQRCSAPTKKKKIATTKARGRLLRQRFGREKERGIFYAGANQGARTAERAKPSAARHVCWLQPSPTPM